MLKIGSPLLLIMILFALPVSAQSDNAGEPSTSFVIKDISAKLSPSGSGAVYMTLENNSSKQHRLMQAHSSIAERTEIHAIKADENGVMQMVPIDGLDISVNETVALKPGGYHIMLMGIDYDSHKNRTSFPVTLYFDKLPSLTVKAIVEDIGMNDDINEDHESDSHEDHMTHLD